MTSTGGEQTLTVRSRTKFDGENPVYGQTQAGRYVFCVVIRFPDGNGYPVTARDELKKRGVNIENGKTDEEIKTADNRFDPKVG